MNVQVSTTDTASLRVMSAAQQLKAFQAQLDTFPHTFQLQNMDQLRRDNLERLETGLQSALLVGYNTGLEIARGRNFLAYILHRLGREEDSLKEIDKVLSMDGQHDNLVSLANKAVIRWLYGNRPGAQDIAESLQAIRKTSKYFPYLVSKAQAELAFSYTRLGPEFCPLAIAKFSEVIPKAQGSEKWLWQFGLAMTKRRLMRATPESSLMESPSSVSERSQLLQQFLEIAKNSDSDNLKAKVFSEVALLLMFSSTRKEEDPAMTPVEACEKALKLDDNDKSVLCKCGQIFRYVRQTERSAEVLENALKIRPSARGYHHLGLTFKALATQEKYKDRNVTSPRSPACSTDDKKVDIKSAGDDHHTQSVGDSAKACGPGYKSSGNGRSIPTINTTEKSPICMDDCKNTASEVIRHAGLQLTGSKSTKLATSKSEDPGFANAESGNQVFPLKNNDPRFASDRNQSPLLEDEIKSSTGSSTQESQDANLATKENRIQVFVSEENKGPRLTSEENRGLGHASEENRGLGHASEKDTGLGHASEKDTGLGHASKKDTGLGHASEKDTGLGHASEKDTGLGHASENDTGLGHVSEEYTGLGHASEEDTGLGHASEKDTGLGHASEEEEGLCHVSEEEEGLCHVSEEEEGLCHVSEEEEGLCHVSEEEEGLCHVSEEEEGLCHVSEEEEGLCHVSEEAEGQCHVSEEEEGPRLANKEDKGKRHASEENKGQGLASEENEGPCLSSKENKGQGLASEENEGPCLSSKENKGQGLASEENEGPCLSSEENEGPCLSSEENEGPCLSSKENKGQGLASEENEGPCLSSKENKGLGVVSEESKSLGLAGVENKGPGHRTSPAVIIEESGDSLLARKENKGIQSLSNENEGLRFHTNESRYAGLSQNKEDRARQKAIKSPPKGTTTFTREDMFVEKALRYLKLSVEFSKKANTRAMYDLALMHKSLGELDQSMTYLQMMLSKEQLLLPLERINVYEQIGLVYGEMAESTSDPGANHKLNQESHSMLMMALKIASRTFSASSKLQIKEMWQSFTTLLAAVVKSDNDKSTKMREEATLLQLVKQYKPSLALLQELEQMDPKQIDDPEHLRLFVEGYVGTGDFQAASTCLDLMKCTLQSAKTLQLFEDKHYVMKVFVRAARQALLEELPSAKGHFGSAFKDAILIASEKSSSSKGTEAANPDNKTTLKKPWDIMILHEDSRDTRTMAMALTKIFSDVYGLRVPIMDRDLPPNRLELEGILDMIEQSTLVVIPAGTEVSDLRQHCISHTALRSPASVVTLLADGEHVPKLLRTKDHRAVRCPKELLGVTLGESGTCQQQDVDMLCTFFCSLINIEQDFDGDSGAYVPLV